MHLSRTKSQSFRTYMVVAGGLSVGIFLIAWTFGDLTKAGAFFAILMLCSFIGCYAIG